MQIKENNCWKMANSMLSALPEICFVYLLKSVGR